MVDGRVDTLRLEHAMSLTASEIEHRNANIVAWSERLRDIFGDSLPQRRQWRGVREIARVLGQVCGDLNYTFAPHELGGSNLLGARPASEAGCLELDFGNDPSIVKPAELHFESFGATTGWAYFRLETTPLAPTGLHEGTEDWPFEIVLELSPGHYVDMSVWDSREDSDRVVPTSARPVHRRHRGGAWLVVAQMSPLNFGDAGYDAGDDWGNEARGADEFRTFVASLARRRTRRS